MTRTARMFPVTIAWLALVLAAVVPPPTARAQEQAQAPAVGPSTGLPMPRFVSLGPSRVNARSGPGVQYPVSWVYRRAGLPVMVVAEFDTWRQVRDMDGDEGWVHQSLLSGRRTVVIAARIRVFYDAPDAAAVPVFLAEPGAVARLLECEAGWCRVEMDGARGWGRRDHLWGLFPDEAVR